MTTEKKASKAIEMTAEQFAAFQAYQAQVEALGADRLGDAIKKANAKMLGEKVHKFALTLIEAGGKFEDEYNKAVKILDTVEAKAGAEACMKYGVPIPEKGAQYVFRW